MKIEKDNTKPSNIIVMKVGPHSNMSLKDIIESKIEEEKIHGVHYWGYSGVFCHPNKVQSFCEKALEASKEAVKLILIETKSSYESNIGFIKKFSKDKISYEEFKSPVQLQGAQFSFVSKGFKIKENFNLDDYEVVGGKNNGKSLTNHLKFRVNKSFAKIKENNILENQNIMVYETELVYPYAIWLSE